jgi:hypothetical protein
VAAGGRCHVRLTAANDFSGNGCLAETKKSDSVSSDSLRLPPVEGPEGTCRRMH